MHQYANQQIIDDPTLRGMLIPRSVYWKLEEATEDDLKEKELLREWQKNRTEKEGEQKKETDKEQPKPNTKS